MKLYHTFSPISIFYECTVLDASVIITLERLNILYSKCYFAIWGEVKNLYVKIVMTED